MLLSAVPVLLLAFGSLVPGVSAFRTAKSNSQAALFARGEAAPAGAEHEALFKRVHKHKHGKHHRRKSHRHHHHKSEAAGGSKSHKKAPKKKSKPAAAKDKSHDSSASGSSPPVALHQAPTSGGVSALAQESVQLHNALRAKHGAKPLVWDADLAAAAQKWSDRCVWEHGGGASIHAGENLAAWSGNGAPVSSLFKMWADEASDYDSSNPQYSHFTQVVWKGTTKLGCALSKCNPLEGFGDGVFYDCLYQSPGNVIGEFAQNVQA